MGRLTSPIHDGVGLEFYGLPVAFSQILMLLVQFSLPILSRNSMKVDIVVGYLNVVMNLLTGENEGTEYVAYLQDIMICMQYHTQVSHYFLAHHLLQVYLHPI